MAAAEQRVLLLDDRDNVAVAMRDIPAGTQLAQFGLTARDPIPAGHKIAIGPVAAGDPVIKFGQRVGSADLDIAPGSHVHVHNVVAGHFERGAADHSVESVDVSAAPRHFEGILRPGGQVATRNYVGIVTSVNCSATVANFIADSLREAIGDYDSVDGVVAITHDYGCCQGADADGMRQLQRTLTGFCRHPNFAGVLVLGLGCETNQVSAMLGDAGVETGDRLRSIQIQEAGGTRATVDRGREMLLEMLPAGNAIERVPVPVSRLVLGLECGGSDGYSGLSANPALGRAVDLLVAHGGTAILSETPEIYGAEHLLLARAADADVANKLSELIAWWEDYAQRDRASLDNNPTHGNKAGGLTTIYEKSLGAVAKAGSTTLNGVYRYAERVDRNGLVFMDSPGYDPMSITGQVAGGANVVAFTTGRGSVYGCKPTPSIKIATNTPMYERMRDDMDVNCGRIIDGEASIDDMGAEIFERIIETASGRKTRSEALGFGDAEFVPWVPGAQL